MKTVEFIKQLFPYFILILETVFLLGSIMTLLLPYLLPLLTSINCL